MVMRPVEPRALQDHWTGPYEMKECKGEATYLVELQISRNTLRVLHVNRLKSYVERCEVSMLLATDKSMEEESEYLPDLFSAQEKDGSVESVNIKDEVAKMLAVGVIETSNNA
ncbi:hypothetical protein NDU88_002243 [Pleurodeles waltl]|uniref:Uncharacterized protein n=1 Tax=Pleurodeles waltl TaxID=8319 RepID=A0AAV7UV10_PLEWA|nr:hypothetical protein NDU88_002243 [Pleurodeles waltl]